MKMAFLPLFCKITLLLFGLLFFSCVRGTVQVNEGVSFLQGDWEAVEDSSDVFLKKSYAMFFKWDSVYIRIRSRRKIAIAGDSCLNRKEWMEYVKGRYEVFRDTLKIIGYYTRSNFKYKSTGCFHVGQYAENFLYEDIQNNKLLLQSISSHHHRQILKRKSL